MTLSTTINRAGPYTGNGSTTTFARTFRVDDAADLKVYQTSGGTTTEVTTGITKTNIGAASGNVVFDVAPANGVLITLIRATEKTQATDYVAQGRVSPTQVEQDLDLLVMQVQDLSERLDRAPLLPVQSETTGLFMGEPDAGKLVKWSAGGTGLEAGPTCEQIETDKIAAQAAATSAATSESNAAGSATSASGSASAAAASATAAATSETNASGSATDASNSAASSATSATNSAASEANSASSAANSASSADAAATSATNAAASATNAAISASYAAASETAASSSASSASTSATSALADSGLAATSAAEAAVSAAQAALFDGPWIDDVTTLLADTAITYTAGQPGTVAAGDHVRTRREGYAYAVAASGATDHHIVTAGGVKLYVVPQSGVYNVEAWASPLTETALQDAIHQIADIAEAASGRWPLYTMRCSSEVDVADGIEIETTAGAPCTGVNIDFENCRINVVAGGSLTPTDPALTVRARDCTVNLPSVECNSLSSAIYAYDCYSANIYPRIVMHFGSPTVEGFGYRLGLGMDNVSVHGGWGFQWQPADAEYIDLSKWTGVVWDVIGYDFNLIEPRGGWARCMMRFQSSVANVFVDNFHCWQGRAGYAATTVDPVLIENYANGPVYFNHAYFDNGIIHDYTSKLCISNSKFLEYAPAVTLSSPRMRVYAPTTGAYPANVLQGNTGLSVGYFDGPSGQTWGSTISGTEAWWDEQEVNENAANMLQRRVNQYTRGDGVPVEQNHRQGGALVYNYSSGASAIKAVTYDPLNDEIGFGFESLKVNGWKLHGASNALTISAGAITPTAHFHVIDTEGAAATDDLDTISTSGIPDGTMLTLCTAVNTRDVTVKHNVGNIFCGTDRTLSITADVITLVKIGVYWRMVSFADNL